MDLWVWIFHHHHCLYVCNIMYYVLSKEFHKKTNFGT